MKILGIIPARFASTRFPGKPLIDLLGKSMIQRVYEACEKSNIVQEWVVATDDYRIFDHVLAFGGKAIMTSNHHESGTDRCAEVIQIHDFSYFDYVLNVQGDEPLIDANQIDELASILNGEIGLATQIKKCQNIEQLFDSANVKVVLQKNNNALYFSRQCIPFVRGEEQNQWLNHGKFYSHIGMYAYKCDTLKIISKLPKSTLENAEALEQLRWLENGFQIKCIETNYQPYSIDSIEDVDIIIEKIKNINAK